ncbi:MAG: TonB-dependent receptor [Saprospiraceae bacterium]|nr:TonB-dependent receptor [Saprospiraceae bacterium]
MRHLFLFLAICCSSPLFAQKFTLNGTLRDSSGNKPLEFATILLLADSAPDSSGAPAPRKPLKSAFSDSDGKFRFSNLDTGLYRLEISLLGYQPFTQSQIELSDNKDLGIISIAAADNTLQQVTITAAKPILEVKADRIVFNVENDPTAAGSTAIETLQKIPFVTVDQDDNIRLKGKTNFKVQLNGRNTGLFARNPKDALRSFPASAIKRIEVITSPGARYDAEGTAGIINIVTASRIAGVNGSLSSGVNTLSQHNENASVNAKFGRWGISSYFGIGGNRNIRNSIFNRTNYIPTDLYLDSRYAEGKTRNYYYYGNLEIACDIDTLHSVSAYINANDGSYRGDDETNYQGFNAELLPVEQGLFINHNENTWPSTTYGFDFVKKFKKPEQEFSISTALEQSRSKNTSQNDRLFSLGGPNTSARFINRQPEDEFTAEINYTHPIKKDQSFSFGAKTILRRLENDYRQETLDSLSGEFAVFPEQTGLFQYNQDIWGGYTEYSWKRNKWSVRPGLRFEYTKIYGEQTSQTPFTNEYPALVPTLNLSYKITESKSLRLGYSRRIQRPGVWYLRPQLNSADPRNTNMGNPQLLPEFTHNVEVGLDIFKGGRNLSITLEQGITSDAINSVTTINAETGVATTTYGNFGSNNRTALTLYGSGPIGKKLTFYANVTLAYELLDGLAGTAQYRNDGITGNCYGNLQYNIGKGWRIQGNGWWGVGNVTLQGRSNGWYNYQFGINKSLLKNKTLRLGLLADQFLLRDRVFTNRVDDPGFSTYFESSQPARAIRFSASWRFGKLRENVSRKRGVSNSDQKSGSSGGQ